MPKAKDKAHTEITIGADAQPYFDVLNDIVNKTQSLLRGVSRGMGAIGLGGFGALGLNAMLDSDIAQSFQAGEILTSGDDPIAKARTHASLRMMDESFKGTGIEWDAGEFASMTLGFRQSLDAASQGDTGVLRALKFAGFDVDSLSKIRAMQDDPTQTLVNYAARGMASQFKETHPGFYRSSINMLGLQKMEQATRLGLQDEMAYYGSLPPTAGYGQAGSMYGVHKGFQRTKTAAGRTAQQLQVDALDVAKDMGADDAFGGLFDLITNPENLGVAGQAKKGWQLGRKLGDEFMENLNFTIIERLASGIGDMITGYLGGGGTWNNSVENVSKNLRPNE